MSGSRAPFTRSSYIVVTCPYMPIWYANGMHNILTIYNTSVYCATSQSDPRLENPYLVTYGYHYILKHFPFVGRCIEAEGHIYVSVNLSSLVQIVACRLVGANPLSEPLLEYCSFQTKGQTSVKSCGKFIHFVQKYVFENVVWEFQPSMCYHLSFSKGSHRILSYQQVLT